MAKNWMHTVRAYTDDEHQHLIGYRMHAVADHVANHPGCPVNDAIEASRPQSGEWESPSDAMKPIIACKQRGLIVEHDGKLFRTHVGIRYGKRNARTPAPQPEAIAIRSKPQNWNANPGDDDDLSRATREFFFGPYKRVGLGLARKRYDKVQRAVERGIKLLQRAGQKAEAEALSSWARGSGGFTRPHSPYVIYVDGTVERIFTAVVRRIDKASYQTLQKCDRGWHVARAGGQRKTLVDTADIEGIVDDVLA